MKINLPEDATPFQLFLKLFTIRLVSKTNMRNNAAVTSRPGVRWTPVTVAKIDVSWDVYEAASEKRLLVTEELAVPDQLSTSNVKGQI